MSQEEIIEMNLRRKFYTFMTVMSCSHRLTSHFQVRTSLDIYAYIPFIEDLYIVPSLMIVREDYFRGVYCWQENSQLNIEN